MVKKIFIVTMLTAVIGVLFLGAVNRTQAKAIHEIMAAGQGAGGNSSGDLSAEEAAALLYMRE